MEPHMRQFRHYLFQTEGTTPRVNNLTAQARIISANPTIHQLTASEPPIVIRANAQFSKSAQHLPTTRRPRVSPSDPLLLLTYAVFLRPLCLSTAFKCLRFRVVRIHDLRLLYRAGNQEIDNLQLEPLVIMVHETDSQTYVAQNLPKGVDHQGFAFA